MRPPRRIGHDRLVDWKLIVQSYGFVGLMETTASFAMSYWYLQRQGFPFSALWFSFGSLPDTIDADAYAEQLNVASSIYFVTLVVMCVALLFLPFCSLISDLLGPSIAHTHMDQAMV